MEFDLSKIDLPDPKIYCRLKGGQDIGFPYAKDSFVVGYRAKASSYLLKLPRTMTNELSYVVGALLGDGCIKKTIKRKRGGYHYTIDFTGTFNSVSILSEKIYSLFGYKPKLIKDRRKVNTWFFNIHSVIIHRFFTQIIGFIPGKKSGNIPLFESVCLDSDIFRYFLAGLIDTDGYVSRNYGCIVQKDKDFLEWVRKKSKVLLGIQFQEPKINRIIDNDIKGWWIIVRGKELEKLKSLPLEIKKFSGPGGI